MNCLFHGHTQDFTIEGGLQGEGAEPEDPGDGNPSGVQGQSPGRKSRGTKLPKAEAKCEN